MYLRGDTVIVYPINRAVSGLGISSEPVFRLSRGSISGVGDAVLAALEAFREGLPQPDFARGEDAAFLRAAGFRSWRTLESGSVSCWFDDDGSHITFEPLRYGGTRGARKGFQPFGAEPVVLASGASATEVGTAALLALERAE